jgi:hypothetical protein
MTDRMIVFTPDIALQCAEEGRLEEWLHDFLLTVGKNAPLSHGLRLQERYWFGPCQFPLHLLTPCCGPDDGMEYPARPDAWQGKIAQMCASLAEGWEPPPLLVQYRKGGVLSLRDGNHRHTALVRSGITEYWTIFWFDREGDRARFLAAHCEHCVMKRTF